MIGSPVVVDLRPLLLPRIAALPRRCESCWLYITALADGEDQRCEHFPAGKDRDCEHYGVPYASGYKTPPESTILVECNHPSCTSPVLLAPERLCGIGWKFEAVSEGCGGVFCHRHHTGDIVDGVAMWLFTECSSAFGPLLAYRDGAWRKLR